MRIIKYSSLPLLLVILLSLTLMAQSKGELLFWLTPNLDTLKYNEGTRNVHYYTYVKTDYPGDIQISYFCKICGPVTVNVIKASTKVTVLTTTFIKDSSYLSVPRDTHNLEV